MSSLKHYLDYLDEIVGFFVVEDYIMEFEPTLATKVHKDELWEMALKRIIDTMNRRFVRDSLFLFIPLLSGKFNRCRDDVENEEGYSLFRIDHEILQLSNNTPLYTSTKLQVITYLLFNNICLQRSIQ